MISHPPIHPELRRFVDAVIVPALVERFLREQQTDRFTVVSPTTVGVYREAPVR